MTQEEKQLLLKDLCGRVPYGVNFSLGGSNVYTIKGIDLIVTDEGDREYAVTAYDIEPIEIAYIKPYLRPMNTMTEEEKIEWRKVSNNEDGFVFANEAHLSVDWLDENMFDYRGLIPMGLALEAPDGMYKED